MSPKQVRYSAILILVLVIMASFIALPSAFSVTLPGVNRTLSFSSTRVPILNIPLGTPLKQGLDIQGGMQVVLRADMSQIAEENRETAIESAQEVIRRRVDMFGISEPVVQTARQGDEYRLIVELAGVEDPQQALQLIGTTAELDFRLLDQEQAAAATDSAQVLFSQFASTGLTGRQLTGATVQFDPQTGQPVVGIEFDQEGRELFADITTEHTGEMLAIFLDGAPLMIPQIQTPIVNGQAVITGDFSVEEARNLSIQLNAGALPVPIEVLEQRVIGASLGQESVTKSVQAGLVGIGLVMIFMILYYGASGFLASIALVIYAILTIAMYKLFEVTLTLPGIAGMLLTIGMAVDANILIFERMKEELRDGQPFDRAMELGFGRAWDSIKDANLATIMTALVLINPFDLEFLNRSGLVRGFGITLLIGVLMSLFTGILVTRTLMKLFLKGETHD